MTLRDEIAQEIARRLVEEHPRKEGQPAPAAKEVDASAYPPRTVRSWCIPVTRGKTAWATYQTQAGEIAKIGMAVDSLWLDRDSQPWVKGGLAVYVWHGYHAKTNTIYYAIHPAPYPRHAQTRTP
jgi:hypothetical protein